VSGLHRRSQVILEDPGMDGTRFDPLTLARPDGGSAPVFHEDTVLPRAEVLRRLRWQQREWARMLATHGLDTPCLVAPGDGPGLNDTLDLLQEAGEYVPARFYRRELLARTTAVASGTGASVSLTDLLADITEVLAWFDPEPIASSQGIASEHPRSGADAAPKPHDILAGASPNVDNPVGGVRAPQGPGTVGWTSGEEVPWGVGQGGGGLTGKPRDAAHEAAAAAWTVGDQVMARANAITVRAGSRGTVVGFSGEGGHPLVDFHGSGRVLIRAEHLDRDDAAPVAARIAGRPPSSGTTRLSARPRPSTVVATLPPPPPDWCDRPSATTET
jgi:hypothetical protein